jgi:hypothetical protein
MKAVVVLAVLLASACSSSRQTAAPDDTMMRQDAHAAGQALSLERPNEAIAQYKLALERARARDDAAAIGDYGYDMAVAQLAANEPNAALATVRMTRSELARRGATSFAVLDLAEATACYRIDDKATSDRLASQVEAGADPVAALRASFLRGLIADQTDDVAGLDRAIARLAPAVLSDQQADLAELVARRDIRQGAFAAAAEQAGHAADLRREALDYRGMARALVVAANAEAHAGHTRLAADYYMRAGQSAAAQGDAITARPWLQRATELGDDATLHEAARSAITALQLHK